ncbi:Syntaxin-61 [Raphanus sativus]|nr:Syntaxin-61 [Raphanus sativus]
MSYTGPKFKLFNPRNAGDAFRRVRDTNLTRRNSFTSPPSFALLSSSKLLTASPIACLAIRDMSSAQDPFYIVKEEIQDSIDKLQSAFHKWERISPGMGDQVHATKELLANCGSIEWQVDELEKAITVAAKDPALYGIDDAELERRRRWTSNARTQVRNVKTGVLAGKGNAGTGNASEVRLELMRMPNSTEANRYDQYGGRDDDGFVQSESDRQMLLIKQQDEELDELSKSVERIGGVGLTIHDELVAQERIIDELGTEMDSTKNRLDFVQKKVGMVMKKAGAKGQMMMICFLLVLFIILFVLVFLT